MATGILLFIAFVPPSEIGKGFGRFHAGLALALWVLACWGNFHSLFFVLAVVLLMTAMFSEKNVVYYPLLFASIVLSFWLLILPDIPNHGVLPSLAIHIPGILVLGGSSVSMLLGHWYLVAPKLSIHYLKMVTIALIAALGIRAGLLVFEIVKSQAALGESHFFEIYGIFLVQRVVFGLLLTIVLSVMTYFCVRIRSTQSATGILYVVVVFCLVGELIGRYLFAKTGIPF